ncbi:hypothetical protein [Nocardioides sp. B-3]|uniref:hypothetical protein n=1 Tax=Nocardioides sp. B-3 TaxID=2895565 RepID=UPI0021539433|nr:hypothetical protein [Nocardioides sp. B-3]UUZ61903.1 hypothetical protein LP418_21040 [Nocardioides sp. B-3]
MGHVADGRRIVNDFIRTTDAAAYDREDWRALLAAGPRIVPLQAEAAEAPIAPVHVMSTGA